MEMKKDQLSEDFEIELQMAETQAPVGYSRKSEIDFARQQMAMQYLIDSASEIDWNRHY